MGGVRLAQPIVSMAATRDGRGYWLVGADGGVFALGDAGYFGSVSTLHLSAPIVGITPSVDGAGYWLVGADGGVFAFGDAQYFGSMAKAKLRAGRGSRRRPQHRGLLARRCRRRSIRLRCALPRLVGRIPPHAPGGERDRHHRRVRLLAGRRGRRRLRLRRRVLRRLFGADASRRPAARPGSLSGSGNSPGYNAAGARRPGDPVARQSRRHRRAHRGHHGGAAPGRDRLRHLLRRGHPRLRAAGPAHEQPGSADQGPLAAVPGFHWKPRLRHLRQPGRAQAPQLPQHHAGTAPRRLGARRRPRGEPGALPGHAGRVRVPSRHRRFGLQRTGAGRRRLCCTPRWLRCSSTWPAPRRPTPALSRRADRGQGEGGGVPTSCSWARCRPTRPSTTWSRCCRCTGVSTTTAPASTSSAPRSARPMGRRCRRSSPSSG